MGNFNFKFGGGNIDWWGSHPFPCPYGSYGPTDYGNTRGAFRTWTWTSKYLHLYVVSVPKRSSVHSVQYTGAFGIKEVTFGGK